MKTVADKLAIHDGGHNKFLESIVVWLDISAPRYWWSEFDTYRVGVTKQSESTMHTITKRHLTTKDFEGNLVTEPMLAGFNYLIDYHNNSDDKLEKQGCFMDIKRLLPESFIQRRVVCTNYKTLRNIYQQRNSHRLPEWQHFCSVISTMTENPNWIRG